jgi:hypothetical protein
VQVIDGLKAALRPADATVLARACRWAIPGLRSASYSPRASLDAAYSWLCAAHDAPGDGGVAGCYNLLKGWSTSYPETTGYIIPTFLRYAETRHVPDAVRRAIRMADWEVEVQLPDGAVRSGMLGTEVGPAVFNTGQVLFGWVSAHAATHHDRYVRAVMDAADWLVKIQDEDGAWRKHLSMLTTSPVQTYNTRTAWGLATAGSHFNERRWTSAASRNCDWALSQQAANGWFANNAFSNDEEPLLHTIGYVLEGLLGVGEQLRREQYVRAAIDGAAPLVDLYNHTGGLKGRYNSQWQSATSWRCLTGEAQLALVLLRLAAVTGERHYAETGRSILKGVALVQDCSSPYRETRGAIGGSEPIWGGYVPFGYPNWAAKFFMDALLEAERQEEIDRKAAPI